jgi:hypothetical protein
MDRATGNALVVWDDLHSVRVRRYDAGRNAWDDAKVIETRSTPVGPEVGIDAMGHAMVVWHQNYDVDPDLMGVWASRSTDQVAWSPPVRIAAVRSFNATLTVASNGNARTAFDATDGMINSLWSAYFDGSSWTMPTQPVLVGTDPDERTPVLAMDGAGHGALVWQQRDGQQVDSVWGATFDGPTLAAPRLLDDYVTDSAWVGDVTMNGDGRGLVMWTQRTPSGQQLWYRPILPGTGFGGASQFTAVPDGSNTRLAIDAAGTVTACWAQSGAGSRYHVWSSRLPSGGAWSTPAALETTNFADGDFTDTTPNCRLAVDGQGNLQAVWLHRETATADRFGFSLFGARYSGGTWSAAQKIAGKDMMGVSQPHLVSSSGGLSMAAYFLGDPAMTGDVDAFNVFTVVYR